MEAKLKKGDVVKIYYDPITKQQEEGLAKLIKFNFSNGNQEYWDVSFISGRGKVSPVTYGRFIEVSESK